MIKIVEKLDAGRLRNQKKVIEAANKVFFLPDGEYHKLATLNASSKAVNTVEAATEVLFDSWATGKLDIPLHFFNGVSPKPTHFSIDIILDRSPLAKDILRTLRELGTEDRVFATRPRHGRVGYERTYRLLIAGLALAATPQITSLEDLGAEGIEQWLYFYASPKTQHFRRPEFWGASFNVAGKCLKEIAKSLGNHFNSFNIRSFGKIQRNNAFQRLADDTAIYPVSPKIILDTPPAHLAIWRVLYDQWRLTERPRGRSPFTAIGRMLCWVNTFPAELAGNPERFLCAEVSPRYAPYIKKVREQAGQKPSSTTLCSELRDIRYFSIFVREKFALSAQIKPLVTTSEISESEALLKRQGTVRSSAAEVGALPLPFGKYELLREILEEGENGWPGRHSSCQAVLEGKQHYVPVLPALFLVPFDLPERFAQLRRMDSGEGDKLAFNGETLAWDINAGPHAGYWERAGSDDSMHGYAQKTSNPKITGFFINTNKTGKPWVIPWQNARVHKLLWELRCWVERWVPLKGPISSQEVADAEMPDEGYSASYPEVFPLFRMPAGRVSVGGTIVTRRQINQFWLDLMLEVQTRWNNARPPEKHEFFVELNRYGQPSRSRYGAHGMRSAGITRMLQAGVSLNTVSRLGAGHATLLMTWRYWKLDPLQLHKEFDEGRLRANALEAGNFISDLDRWSLEEAAERTVSASVDALENALLGDRNSWVQTDLGLCPWEGMRCGDGGPLRKAGQSKTGRDKSEYDAVEGGHGNCVLCRHYVTEKRFAAALISFSATVSRRLTIMSRRILDLQEQVSAIEIAMNGMGQNDAGYLNADRELKSLNIAINDVVMKQTPVANTLVRIQEILHQFEQLDQGTTGEPAWIVQRDTSVEEWLAVSDFEQASLIVNAGRIYKSAYDPEAELVRQRYVDEIAIRSGYQPIYLSARTEVQRKESYDLAVKNILERATRTELMMLEGNGITFDQLGFDKQTIQANFIPLRIDNKKLVSL